MKPLLRLGITTVALASMLFTAVQPAHAQGDAASDALALELRKNLAGNFAVTVVAASESSRAVFTVKPSGVGVNAPGASIACSVSYGNDVTVYDGFLNVTWAVACRYVDDNELAYFETDSIYMIVGIRRNGAVIPPSIPCNTPGPSATCSHRVPFDASTSARYDSAMLAYVFWKDNYPPIRGGFASPGFTYT